MRVGANIWIVITALFLTFLSCQKREWNNPFDPECPKELFTPSGLIATQEGTQIKLQWSQKNTQITGFIISVSENNGPWNEVARIPKANPTYIHLSPVGGVKYGYQVFAYANENKSNPIQTSLTALSVPTITTASQTNVTATSFVLGGIITNDGGSAVIERGIVYATTQNPTTSNHKIAIGSGTGTFSTTVMALTPNTTYFSRAYAINSQGIAYGNQIIFKTFPSLLPVSGLVAWYPFDGNANDESGNSNHGTVNGATLTSSRSGTPNNAYMFSGSNYINFGANTNLVPDNFSISGWFKASILNPDINVLIRARWNGYSVYMSSNGKIQFNCSITGETLSIVSTSIYNDNQWHNFVATFGNYTCKFYIDGSLIGSKVGNSNKLSTELGAVAIGRDGDNNGWFFKGYLDDFGIWNRALTDQEVQNISKMQ